MEREDDFALVEGDGWGLRVANTFGKPLAETGRARILPLSGSSAVSVAVISPTNLAAVLKTVIDSELLLPIVFNCAHKTQNKT